MSEGDWIRRDGGRWGWRTVKNDAVRWLGDYYTPDEREATLTADVVAAMSLDERAKHRIRYDGRLEGERLLFYTYGRVARAGSPFIDSHLFLWGNGDWPGPNCVDGVFRFESWRKVGEDA